MLPVLGHFKGWLVYLPHTVLRQYFEHRGHLAVVDDLLLYDDRIVIPRSMRLDILKVIHEGHLGITKCCERARTSVWWPNMSKSVEDTVANCTICTKVGPEPRGKLMCASFPSRPWERVGMTRWVDMMLLASQTSETVINILKSIFSTHGIPDIVMSDNGPQFSADLFHQFAEEYGLVHVTSSPRYPQANGEVERAVRTVKMLLKKNSDPYMN